LQLEIEMIMKKFTLIAALLAAVSLSNIASAQSFSCDKDTSKTAWGAVGYPVDVHIKASNATSSDIYIYWRLLNLHKDANWTLDGACDNKVCLVEADPGFLDGTGTFTTNVIHATEYCDFKVTFLGDAAANGSKAIATLELKSGSTTDTATFIGYKSAAGISGSILQNNDVSIFPNPATNYIDVVYNPSSDVKSITVYNLIGKIVNVYKVTNKNSARCEFNADMPSGIYFVRIADSKGNIIATRKITHQ
jgi:hypothetical protein